MTVIRFFLVLTLLVAGCKPDKSTDSDDLRADAEISGSQDMNSNDGTLPEDPAKSDPVTAEHYVFVGKPVPTSALDCDFWEGPDSPRRQPAPPPGDEVSHGNQVPIQLLEVVQNPGGVGVEDAPKDRQDSVPTASVLFSMGQPRQLGAWPDTRTYCEHLQELFAADFVVLVAYPVRVDWRNSEVTPWKETWYSLGSGPGNPNKAFASREQAVAYARSLVNQAG